MFNGTITIVTDINLAMQCASQGCKVCYVGDAMNNNYPMFIQIPLLSPCFEALNAGINGDMNSFATIYINQLNSPECYYTFMALLSCIYKDENVILYIEESEVCNYAAVLQEYVLNTFGIMIGSQNCPSGICTIPDVIYIQLYNAIDGLITTEEFINNCNLDVLYQLTMTNDFIKDVYNKLSRELGNNVTWEMLKSYQEMRRSFVDPNTGITQLLIKEV